MGSAARAQGLLVESSSTKLVQVEYYDANDNKLPSADGAHHKAETTFVDSVGGVEKVFFPSGKIMRVTSYAHVKQQLRHGEATTWYGTGQLHSKDHYVAGKRQGELVVYFPNGRLKRRDIFKQDKLVNGQCFGIDGKKVKHFDYECMPTYPGGVQALLNDIKSNLQYPSDALKAEVQGKVLVGFTVGKTGRIANAHIIEGLSPSTNAEAIRVVQQLKQLKPALQDGEAASVNFSVPLNFVLQ